MEKLIIKYLTDQLNDKELDLLRVTLSEDEKFRREFQMYLATLALTDYSLDYAPADINKFTAKENEKLSINK